MEQNLCQQNHPVMFCKKKKKKREEKKGVKRQFSSLHLSLSREDGSAMTGVLRKGPKYQ